jgi:hypothetical protein
MNEFEQALITRFGQERVATIAPAHPGDIPLLKLSLELRSPITVLMTNGLHAYEMPVPEKFKEYASQELYFCLPSYWDLDDPDNSLSNWVYPWIQKLAAHVVSKQTWYGPAHTIPCGNPPQALSATMKQSYLYLAEPIFLANELQPVQLSNREVHFLGIIPIFEDEMDYKLGKGPYKLQQKLKGQGITELLDDYRMTSLKSKWRFWK